jgi:uncharacterized membrane protein (UPF0127 family)
MRNKRVLIVVAGIMLFGLLFWTFSDLFRSEPSSGRIKTKNPTDDFTEVPFTKEGQLWFLTAEGDTIEQFEIEVADNPYESMRGLMDRNSMEDNQAMLFIFKDMRQRSFWMKNTRIPLDIIYIDDQYEVVSIQKNAVPKSEQSLPSEGPAKYVVEVNAGLTDLLKIDKESKVVFEVE